MKLNDLTGKSFGKLTVIEEAGRNNLKKVLWKCKCSCGNEVFVVSGSLVTGNTTSCGCIIPHYKHGGTNKGSYNTWRAMVRRCTKPTDKDYINYGAKGVTICNRWMEYENFVADMGEPVGDETLDRINPYGNYEPSNCRWAGVKTQCRNTRVRASNKLGITGVSKVGNKYMAKITAGKKAYYSKCFSDLADAVQARKELERKHWGNG